VVPLRVKLSSSGSLERLRPCGPELEFNEEKLAAHGIEPFEVIEVLWNGFQPLRDKKHDDRYRLLGRTDAGRPLELVVVVTQRTLALSPAGDYDEEKPETYR
jgi:hypothetical protein